jgi:glycosyltransferase involved in cell wall biosynthesis
MSKVDISVWMTTYNHEKFIRQSIDAILEQQTDYSFELVIGDDLSSDNTRKICEEYANKYPAKINLLPSDKRYGMMANFIRTLEQCKGKYLALCEGDDYWINKNKLQKQVEFLEANPDYSICAHDVFFLRNKRKLRNYQWDAPPHSDLKYLLSKGNFLATLSVVVRNHPNLSTFLGQFPKSPVVDYLIYVSSAQRGKIRFMQECMGVYRIHSGGVWSQMNMSQAFFKGLNVLEMVYDNLGPEVHDYLRIQLLYTIDSILRFKDTEEFEQSPVLKSLVEKMGVQPYMSEYLKFSIAERAKSSFYSKTVPLPMLVSAIMEKVRNRISGI